jgi:hypothetical protein
MRRLMVLLPRPLLLLMLLVYGAVEQRLQRHF